jgi:hypothetical protein
MLSDTIMGLMSSPLIRKPGQKRADPAVLAQLRQMYENARALEQMLEAKERLPRLAPIMSTRAAPINPRWVGALGVYGD